MTTREQRNTIYKRYNHSAKGLARRDRYAQTMNKERLQAIKQRARDNFKERLSCDPELLRRHRSRKAFYARRRRAILKSKTGASIYSSLPDSMWEHGQMP